MKISRELILNVAAFTVGSVLAEIMLQREERRRRKDSPASPAGMVEAAPAPGGDCGNPSCDVPWHHPAS